MYKSLFIIFSLLLLTGMRQPSHPLNRYIETNATSGFFLVSAYILNSGTPSVSREDWDWINTLTDNATGDVSINVKSDVFSAAPNCTAIAYGGSFSVAHVTSTTSSVVRVRTADVSATSQDRPFMVICVGAK